MFSSRSSMQKKTFKNQIVRLGKYLYLKIFRINDSPLRIALGFGLGAFLGVMPGVGPVAALVLSFLLRVNRASALLGSIIFNTWVSVVALLLAVKTGSAVMGLDHRDVYAAASGIVRDFQWGRLFELSVHDILAPVAIGFLIVSLCIAAVAAVAAYFIVLHIRSRRRSRGR